MADNFGLKIGVEGEKEFKSANYGEFKKSVADTVCEFLEKIQKRMLILRKDLLWTIQ